MRYTILGTSHIAKQSIQEITTAIKNQKPGLVAVELDAPRAQALMQDAKGRISISDIRQIGIKGFIFAKLGQIIQQKLGKMVGISPGSEMKTALELAAKNNIPLALIDQPIRVTLQNFSKALTWREKGRFATDVVKGLLFPKKQIAELGLDQFDLHKVPDQKVIEHMMGQLKKRYPSIYKTLVEDRNRYMVKKLVHLLREKPEKNMLVIVGAGHKSGMEEILLKVNIV